MVGDFEGEVTLDGQLPSGNLVLRDGANITLLGTTFRARFPALQENLRRLNRLAFEFERIVEKEEHDFYEAREDALMMIKQNPDYVRALQMYLRIPSEISISPAVESVARCLQDNPWDFVTAKLATDRLPIQTALLASELYTAREAIPTPSLPSSISLRDMMHIEDVKFVDKWMKTSAVSVFADK